MENRQISFLVRNLLSIINLAKILTNNERFKNLKKRWLWWLKWRKKLTMNLAKKWCMTELFFVRLLQMYLFSVAMLPCTSNTRSRWVMKRTEKIKWKIFFSSIYFALQSMIVYLNSYQSSIFFSGHCCPNPHLLVD
jgi:hypothetical protein